VVYLADELYIMSGMELPPYTDYEDFPQIENGVGLVALFKNEFKEGLHELDKKPQKESRAGKRHVSIATGMSVYKYIKEMVMELEKRYNKLKVSVYPIKNSFFGENVTVTGILTGSDLLEQLKSRELGSELLISRSMLKSGEELFLDDFTVSMLSRKLGTKVTIVENSGEDFIKKIAGM
jgi:NifB/MoaA-like Fe-S oxidoreductase